MFVVPFSFSMRLTCLSNVAAALLSGSSPNTYSKDMYRERRERGERRSTDNWTIACKANHSWYSMYVHLFMHSNEVFLSICRWRCFEQCAPITVQCETSIDTWPSKEKSRQSRKKRSRAGETTAQEKRSVWNGGRLLQARLVWTDTHFTIHAKWL